MSGAQDHAGRLARLECFLPTRSTEAPTVAGFQAAKTEFRHRCRKIVAAGFGKLEKRGGHDGADRVATDVLSPSVAAAVSKEPRHWAYRLRAAHRARYRVCPADRLHYRCRPSALPSPRAVLSTDYPSLVSRTCGFRPVLPLAEVALSACRRVPIYELFASR